MAFIYRVGGWKSLATGKTFVKILSTDFHSIASLIVILSSTFRWNRKNWKLHRRVISTLTTATEVEICYRTTTANRMKTHVLEYDFMFVETSNYDEKLLSWILRKFYSCASWTVKNRGKSFSFHNQKFNEFTWNVDIECRQSALSSLLCSLMEKFDKIVTISHSHNNFFVLQISLHVFSVHSIQSWRRRKKMWKKVFFFINKRHSNIRKII